MPNRQSLLRLLVSGFYLGYAPAAPGTIASLFALLAWFALVKLGFWLLLGLVLFLFVLASYLCHLRVSATGEKDPGYIVIDEILGMWIALLILGTGNQADSFYFVLIAFLFFRIFDIWKIFPLKSIEKIRGGMGIMLDDAVAGIYAGVITRLIAMVLA